jgi:hypothetical protein
MKIGQMKKVEVEAKTLKLHLKVCDMFTASLHDQDGEEIFSQDDGYVPGFMPGEHFGDYVILDIDIDSGIIKNWKQPTAEKLQEWITAEEA